MSNLEERVRNDDDGEVSKTFPFSRSVRLALLACVRLVGLFWVVQLAFPLSLSRQSGSLSPTLQYSALISGVSAASSSVRVFIPSKPQAPYSRAVPSSPTLAFCLNGDIPRARRRNFHRRRRNFHRTFLRRVARV